jgi:AcrR family transcriptional regulator
MATVKRTAGARPEKRKEPREKPSTTKAEETRARILEAALTLFRKRGFDQTTMRDIASEAGVATGAAYYYFRSKEEMVMALYLLTAEEARSILPSAIAGTKDLGKRIHAIIDLTFQQFANHRSLLGALMKVGLDPSHPLSPLGKETKEIREAQIENFRRALDGSNVSIPKDLVPHLPRLFWFYQLGLIAFWIYDDSPARRRTQQLFDGTLDLILQMIRLSALPLMGTVRKRVLNVLRLLEE